MIFAEALTKAVYYKGFSGNSSVCGNCKNDTRIWIEKNLKI